MGFDFEKLDVYQESLSFADSVYELTAEFPRDEAYGVTAQLRRAAVSVAVNIAEGSGRSKKEFAHYLRIARTSIWECVPLLTIAERQGYLGENGFRMFYRRCESLSKMLSQLINSLRRV
jgi:four helix bundle protein